MIDPFTAWMQDKIEDSKKRESDILASSIPNRVKAIRLRYLNNQRLMLAKTIVGWEAYRNKGDNHDHQDV